MTAAELLQLASIPIVSALVGWGTNVLALKMTFYPIEFKGLFPPLGWQGIIPSKAEKMAAKTVDLMTAKLVGVEEVFARLEPERVVEELHDEVRAMLEGAILEVIDACQARATWDRLPEALRQEIMKKASQDARLVILEAFEDVRDQIHDLLDIKRMAIEALMRDKSFLNQIFLECGSQEFVFIERSGVIFGFLFGLAQMALWSIYQEGWTLPAAGFVVGWATNFLALKMIFEPMRARRIGSVSWQGLFLKRQDEVSEAYARMITQQIVNTQNILREILHGPAADRLLDLIERHVARAVEAYAGPNEIFFNMVVGSARYAAIREALTARIVATVPDGPLSKLHDYAEEAMDLEGTMRERLKRLPPEDFVGLLRPIFQEDEWKLILVGAVLGLLAGMFQAVVVFGQGM